MDDQISRTGSSTCRSAAISVFGRVAQMPERPSSAAPGAPAPHERGEVEMAKGRESFEKRARELKRQQRATLKREKREERGTAEPDAEPVDEEALMLKYGQLSERREAGEIDEETFEQERVKIFVELGLVPAGE
jgi:hypothetical protein